MKTREYLYFSLIISFLLIGILDKRTAIPLKAESFHLEVVGKARPNEGNLRYLLLKDNTNNQYKVKVNYKTFINIAPNDKLEITCTSPNKKSCKSIKLEDSKTKFFKLKSGQITNETNGIITKKRRKGEIRYIVVNNTKYYLNRIAFISLALNDQVTVQSNNNDVIQVIKIVDHLFTHNFNVVFQ